MYVPVLKSTLIILLSREARRERADLECVRAHDIDLFEEAGGGLHAANVPETVVVAEAETVRRG